MYDIVFRRVQVADGTGKPRFESDVAVKGDTIARVGEDLPGGAHRIVEGDGRTLTPGFIDIHTHSDFNLLVDHRAESKVRQGVTTEVVGNCGGGAAPVSESGLGVAREQLERLGVGGDISWRTMGEYLDTLSGRGISINALALVGHGAIRSVVMGYDARRPRADELASMGEHLREAMDAGAFGMSTGIYYAPGSYAEIDELVEMCRIVAEYGGIHSTHIRDESNYNIGLMAALDEVLEITRQSGASLQISHLKALGPAVWGQAPAILEKIEAARDAGLDVTADQYPYAASGSSITGALIPRWAQEGGRSALLGRIDDATQRDRLLEEVNENIARRGGPDRMMIALYHPDRDLEGLTLEQAAVRRGLDPARAALELLHKANASFVSFVMQEEDVKTIMQTEWVMVGSDGRAVATDGPLSAGHPHPRYYGTFPRLLGHYSRDQELFIFEEAVRKMTSLPADRLGLGDRGRIQVGKKADLVLLRPADVSDLATFEEPKKYPAGIDAVVVNGSFVIDANTHTGTRAGEVLRR